MQAPKKAIEITITVNGFTWDEVFRAMRERVSDIEERRELGGGVSACRYGASHTATIELRDVTPDRFADESIAWLEAQKADRPDQAPHGAPRRVLAGGEPATVVRDDLETPFSVLVERDDLTRERYQPDYVVPADTAKPEEPR